MVARFTYGKHVIMTGTAVIHDSHMIKNCRYKARGPVAQIAIIAGRHMVWWGGFTSGGYAIVAGCTVINDVLVIKPGTGKGYGVMAHGAILARGKMVP